MPFTTSSMPAVCGRPYFSSLRSMSCTNSAIGRSAASVISNRESSTSKVHSSPRCVYSPSGAVVFGSGLAIVPFLHGGVVNDFHWLDERQFLDAVAVAMITPGPVVITVGFIGYLVAGVAGALVAALGVFLPCYLFVIIPAPYYRRWARVPQIKSFVDGVTAAATGAIAGAT